MAPRRCEYSEAIKLTDKAVMVLVQVLSHDEKGPRAPFLFCGQVRHGNGAGVATEIGPDAGCTRVALRP